MPIAGAAAGAAQSLEEILAAQMFKAKLAEQQAMDAKRMQMDEARLTEDLIDRAENRKFRTRQEDRVAAGDREKSNAIGVRRMIGEGITRRVPLDDMQGMAFAEGIDLPQAPTPKMRSVTTMGPNGRPINRMVPESEAVEEYREPPKPTQGPAPDFEWVMRGGSPLQIRKGTAQPGDRPYEKGGGSADGAPSPYASERAQRTVDSVDELMGQVNNWTAGYGSLLDGVPETDALAFASQLETLKANIAFNELSQMREASKTGGALGSVAVREMDLLQSTLGALNTKMKPEQLKQQLQKAKDSVQRWQAAGGQSNEPMRPATSRQPSPSPSSRVDDLLKKYGAKR